MIALKTPLRYPGGKSRAVKKMAEFFPLFKDYDEYREPFLGGGSVALYITQMYPHLDIWVNDLYEPLYNFWCELRDNANEIRSQLVQLKQGTLTPLPQKSFFSNLKSISLTEDDKLLLRLVLSLSILLTSALFLVSLSPVPSASRRQIQTLRCEELTNYPTTGLSLIHI